MIRHAALGLLMLAAFGGTRAGAGPGDLLLSPELSVELGYDGNRFDSTSEASSAFVAVAPRLRLLWFASQGREDSGGVFYRRDVYERSGFSTKTETGLELGLYESYDHLDVKAQIHAGKFEDRAVPLDDHTWAETRVDVSMPTHRRWTPSLQARFRNRSYDSEAAAGEGTQEDRYWQVKPGCTLPVSRRVTVWGEVYGETTQSNTKTADYEGFGAAVGVDPQVAKRMKAGAWAEWGARTYAQTDTAPGEEREDRILSGSLWCSYRLLPELDLFLRGNVDSYSSNLEAVEYDSWQVLCGVRFVVDIPLTTRRTF